VLADYVDPVGRDYAGDWLAAVEPVFVTRGSAEVVDSGWAILVQERRDDTLKPFDQVRTMLRRGGWIALTLVVLVIGILWGVVLLVLNAPKKLPHVPFLKPIDSQSRSSTSASLSSRSADLSGSSVAKT
jgi:hypothetical protein